MVTEIRLDEAVEQIADAAGSALETALTSGELLEDVAVVIRGDRARQTTELPAMWMWLDAATANHRSRTITETWELPIVTTPVVKDLNDPEAGRTLATRFAARSRSVLIADRKLGLDFVKDVKSTRFEASAPWLAERDSGLYSAVSTVTVTFSVLEIT